jgi:hypothetical protein
VCAHPAGEGHFGSLARIVKGRHLLLHAAHHRVDVAVAPTAHTHGSTQLTSDAEELTIVLLSRMHGTVSVVPKEMQTSHF